MNPYPISSFPHRFAAVARLALAAALLALAGSAPAEDSEAEPEPELRLNFREAPLEQVVEFVADLTGRTPLRNPQVDATITLRSQTPLTVTEAIQAIESVLALHEIALVRQGERFLKVVPSAAVRQEGLAIEIAPSDEPPPLAAADVPVSRVVELQHLDLGEIQPILQGLLRGQGHIQPLERTNSLMITDTAANLARVLRLIEYLDRPIPSRVEPRVYELRFARASELAQRLQELIAEEAPAARPRTATPTPRTPPPRTPPGVIRAPPPTEAQAPNADVEAAERGIVRGPVRIVADERTNTLIIFTEPPNFIFFDRIVAVFDRLVEPEITLRVRHLEYAAAAEVAELLKSLIGTETTGEEPRRPAEAPDDETPRGRVLREFLARSAAEQPLAELARTGIGEISPATRVLHDPRSNALLLMGRRSDIAALEQVIDQLDVMLAQVMIEAVIIEVSLSDNVTHGVDWLQQAMLVTDGGRVDPAGRAGIGEPTGGFGGGWRSEGGAPFIDGGSVGRETPLGTGALTYYLSLYRMNIDAIIRAAASSSKARILSTPVVLTTDNVEARIIAGEERPIVTATSLTTGGVQTSQYQYRNIGVELTVTPRINPQRHVVMDIVQTADNVGDTVLIDGNEVPVITKRELHASVSVPNRSTIVLGGLVNSSERRGRTRVPLLGDIPILGLLFRSQTRSVQNTELLVLLTPYVMMTPAEAREETRRLHERANARATDWAEGWSDGDLAREVRGEEAPETETPIRSLEDLQPRLRPARPDPAPAPPDDPETPPASLPQ